MSVQDSVVRTNADPRSSQHLHQDAKFYSSCLLIESATWIPTSLATSSAVSSARAPADGDRRIGSISGVLGGWFEWAGCDESHRGPERLTLARAETLLTVTALYPPFTNRLSVACKMASSDAWLRGPGTSPLGPTCHIALLSVVRKTQLEIPIPADRLAEDYSLSDHPKSGHT